MQALLFAFPTFLQAVLVLPVVPLVLRNSSGTRSPGERGGKKGLKRGRSPQRAAMTLGEGNRTPLQYSYRENPRGQRSLRGYSPWGCTESDTTEAT